ncbi:MAG: SIMPL domain-containing protein [Firmicutes bacterium]|nr:SIMPL domain-containing protein [Bacillota bacterium]
MKQQGKWRVWAVALTLVLLFAAGGMAARAEDAMYTPRPGRLEVHGQATRTLMPDTVGITIGATAEHDDEKGALHEVNEVIENVIASLKALNIPENQIKTNWLDISPRYRTLGASRQIAGYTVSVSLTVTIKNFAIINTVIDTSVAHGAYIGNMRFSHSQEGLAYRQALADAIQAAHDKAESMAAAAGIELGTLLLLRESGDNTYAYANTHAPMNSYMAGEAGTAGTQVMAGEIQISASVDLTYETK